jgi:amino acid adenylation domain-containing protein
VTTDSTTRGSADDTLLRQLDGLSPAKRAFVEQRLRDARARVASAAAIPSGVEGEPAPLSFAQELLWRLEQAAPGTSAYNVPRAMQVRGPLDVAQLQIALDRLVERHAILRTVFVSDGDEPVQVVRPPRAVTLTEFSADSAEEAHRIVREQAIAPFDLAKDLLLRATLVRLAPEEHVLLLLSHHIASDGSSGGIMLRDLDALYRGDDSLAPLAIQYPDFASWQRSQLNDARVDELLGYWRATLAAAPARLELPTDRPRPLAPAFAGARRSTLLPRSVADAVHQTAREHSTTPFVVLLAAFEVLLHRYSRQDDIIVGTVVTGRGQPELEGLIGYFSNTLPVRVTFENDPTFADVIARVRDASLGANEHADLPYESIALDLRAGGKGGRAGPSLRSGRQEGERSGRQEGERSGRQEALFDVMFAMIDEGASVGELGDAVVVPIALDRGVAKFDLTIGPAFVDEGLRVGMEYRTDLFDDATIVRMLGHYGNVLATATKSPQTRVSRLSMLSADERDLVLKEWNSTAVSYPADATLVSLLEAQERRTPNAIAVALAGQAAEPGAPTTLTFAELDARATTLARALVYRGVKPGVLVGVCMERSLEMVVALVAVLKAGGAYVPLDPEYPADRLAFMISDAKCPVLLTQRRVAETVLATLPHGGGAHVDVLSIDSEWSTIVSDATTLSEPLPAVTPDDLAYMIYTSGSTGKPKGALNRHRGIVNRLLWMQDAYKLGASDSVLQKTPFSFDVSVWEFFLPLLTGARLVMAEPGGHRDPTYLAKAIVEQKITVLHFVPSMLRAFLEEPAAAQCGATLRDVMCSGEALPYDLQQRFFAIVAGTSHNVGLHNLYGPTECAVDVSYWACIRDDERRTVPIGRPVANTQLYVLDDAMEPVPVGVAGELYLGGVQVGAGYWGRRELTNERFVRDPFSAEPEARLYRTGDLARWLADGVVEYLGRLDFQVKLRGFRIELGEIEAALSMHAGVREVVAVAREDLPGGAAIIAYYSTRGDTNPTPAELRALLRESLPEYMVPSAFVELDALPLSPSGKVDRKALPVPEELAAVQTEFVAPRNAAEEQVASIWREVLNVEHVGVHDDFFDIGGHSLLALRVLGRVRQRLGASVSLRDAFEARTIEQFAKRLETATTDVSGSIPLTTALVAPMTHGQELLWLLQRAAPESSAYNVAEQWHIEGALDVDALRRALDKLIVRHEALRTTFGEADGVATQTVGAPRTVPFELIDLPSQAGIDTASAVRDAVRASFDLSSDLLLRATVIRSAPERHLLVLVSHHIVYDGWSRSVLQRDLSALYDAERRGAEAVLEALPLRFLDYAAWQRDALSGAVLTEQLEYWRDHLTGIDTSIDLPVDHARRALPGFEAAKQTVALPLALLEGLRGVAAAHDATLFTVLLAAFQALLHRYSGQTRIAVATVVAGRDRPELEPLVGYFANTVALGTSLEGDPSVDELIERVKAVQLGAADHAAVPLEMLASTDNGARPIAAPNVMFVLQNNEGATLRLGDARVTGAAADVGAAKVDLFLSMAETSQGLRAVLQYRTELFDDATMSRMLGHFETMLASSVVDRTTSIAALPLLTSSERQQLLVEWNDTAAEFPRTRTLADLVSAQAAATPHRIAVVDAVADRATGSAPALTYADLARKTSLLGRALRARGVKPGEFVGVCMERSADMIVCLLAVLEAGGAYVPLDPDYPEERINFMLDDTRAVVVLTQAGVVERMPLLPSRVSAHGGTTLSLDTGWESRIADELEGAAAGEQIIATQPSNVAYVIYTSGSTGRPKGVLIEHRSAVAMVTWAQSVFSADQLAGVLASTSVCFDLSIFEIFVPLASGGTVILVRDALALVTLPIEVRNSHPVTLINTVPSAAAALLRLAGIPSSVRTVNLAGEPLAQRLVEELYELPFVERVYDLYGPSEDTTYSTFTLRTRGGRATVGRPIANTQAYVLDRLRQPVPIGIPGELYLAGEGLARGYLHQDALTDERFVPNPFSPTSRMYRTGDLVRYLPDGRLEYLSRLDHQVKLRGFRIELGEVEAVLMADPAVAKAVAVVREVSPGDSRLIAYVARASGVEFDLARLHASARRALPQYMLPSAIVAMDALPLTQNGKIDRKALPEPELDAVEEEYSAPDGPVEEVIAGVWSELLKRQRLSRDANFFEAGGHSLLATRAIARVNSILRSRIPLRLFFEEPTISGMARAVSAVEERPGQTTIVARAVLKLRSMSAEDRAKLAATRSPATAPDLS